MKLKYRGGPLDEEPAYTPYGHCRTGTGQSIPMPQASKALENGYPRSPWAKQGGFYRKELRGYVWTVLEYR